MSGEHRGRAEIYLLLPAVLLMLATALSVAGCGGTKSDKFVGTWIQKQLPNSQAETPIVVKKDGGKYVLTGPGGETWGYIIHSEPTKSGETTLYSMSLGKDTKVSKDGDTLKFQVANATDEITVSGDTMTIVVPGVQEVFKFSRVAKQGTK